MSLCWIGIGRAAFFLRILNVVFIHVKIRTYVAGALVCALSWYIGA